MSLSKGMIFAPAAPLADVAAKADAARAERVASGEKYADVYANGAVHRELYAETLERLEQPDMLTLEDTAARMGLTPDEYRQRAEAGEVLLIEIEGKQAVPAWQFDANGKVDALKVDIAAEFAREGRAISSSWIICTS